MTNTQANQFKTRFIELVGQMAEMCTFNRSIGQIYGTLYMSQDPLSLDDIAQSCGMSKGNASIHLRTLERWGAVRQSWKTGTRKDYYAANTDLKGLALKRIHEGIDRRIDEARVKFSSIKEDKSFLEYLEQAEGTFAKDRVKEIESLLDQAEKASAMLPKLIALKSLF